MGFPDFSNSKLLHDVVSRHGMPPVLMSVQETKKGRTINLRASHLLKWHTFPSVPYLFMDSANEPVPCGTSEELFRCDQMGAQIGWKVKEDVLLV